jgi:Fe-S-cluster-containing hydrogenase component 2
MTDFILADPARCIGCRTCEVACASAHTTTPLTSSAFRPRLSVVKHGLVSVPVMCHQCENAPCAAACPTGALVQGRTTVEIDEARCIGCNSCVVVCPFGAVTIQRQTDTEGLKVIKCDLCVASENGPACISVCPTAALSLTGAQALAQLSGQRRSDTAISAGVNESKPRA